jgi:RimJ/RimL family protein N-acetyltransferase
MTNYDFVIGNDKIRLRLIRETDVPGLEMIAFDDEIWRFFLSYGGDREGLKSFVDTALADLKSGFRIAFVVESPTTNEIMGSASFANISARDKRIEIGWSWLGKSHLGNAINTNVKYALMRFAFDSLQYERVEFKTDVLNKRARAALIKIGAVEEGVLRSHTLMPGGRRRDTIYYSVLRHEWPNVAEKLIGLGASGGNWHAIPGPFAERF